MKRWMLCPCISSYKSVHYYVNVQVFHKPFCCMVTFGPWVTILGSVLELVTILIEKFAPSVSPVMTMLVSVSTAFTEPFCLPSICW